MPGLIRVSYKNVSGSVVPPFGIVQLNSAPVTSATGVISVQVVKPGNGDGPYMIDAGGGAAVSGDNRYGTCFRLCEGLSWVSYTGSAPTAWQEVGPIDNSFEISVDGIGYWYAGEHDATNDRILVLLKPSSPWYWMKITSVCASGSYSSPTTFNADVWIPDSSSVVFPKPLILTSDTSLQGITCVNYLDAAGASGTPGKIEFGFGYWTLKWLDCP